MPHDGLVKHISNFFSLGSKLRLFLHIKENLGKKNSSLRSRKNNFVFKKADLVDPEAMVR